jgi:hypothetical protein
MPTDWRSGHEPAAFRSTSSPSLIRFRAGDSYTSRTGSKCWARLLELFVRRHEKSSTIVTTNRPTQDWGKFLEDIPATTAILDRFLSHIEILQMHGKSYRLRQRGSTQTSKDNGNHAR